MRRSWWQLQGTRLRVQRSRFGRWRFSRAHRRYKRAALRWFASMDKDMPILKAESERLKSLGIYRLVETPSESRKPAT
jgi:hypothetical protein